MIIKKRELVGLVNTLKSIADMASYDLKYQYEVLKPAVKQHITVLQKLGLWELYSPTFKCKVCDLYHCDYPRFLKGEFEESHVFTGHEETLLMLCEHLAYNNDLSFDEDVPDKLKTGTALINQRLQDLFDNYEARSIYEN